jgi:hypothetical protein
MKTTEERRKYMKEWRDKHRAEIKETLRKYRIENRDRISAYQKGARTKIKKEVIEHYGGVKCVCCGENHIEFLCIDHINGGGNEHRRRIKCGGGVSFCWWLKKNNFPEGYRVLCFNCNQALAIFGYCPHKGGVPIG